MNFAQQFWGAHAPRVLVSVPSPKPLPLRKKKAKARRLRQHARARALPRIAALLFLCFACRAASPVFSNLTPPGAQCGSEVDFTIDGQRLSDARGILFYSPGFEVTKLDALDDKRIKAHVKISPDCALGEHALRVWTASGISELRTLRVGPFPCVDEIEPNNDAAHAQKISMNTTVQGVVKNEDSDWFSIEAKKGERITAEVEGMRLGWTMFDPWLAIHKADGSVLAQDDDSSLFLQDPLVSALALENGTYFIELRTADFSGDDKCKYRLHVGNFPQPLVVYPLGGQAGEKLAVSFLGDVGGAISQTISLPNETRVENLFAEQNGIVAPAANAIRVSRFPNALEIEPNNNVKQATTIVQPLPVALNGVISEPGDVDFFKIKAKKDEVWEMRVFARALRSPLDSVLMIFDAQGKQLASNDDIGASNPDSYLRFKVPADGEYCVSIRDQLKRGGATFAYRVEITPVEPEITLAFPEFVKDSQERQSIVVPRGNRFATLIRAKRSDVDGDLTFRFDDLSKGVALQCDPMPANVDTVPMVFEADADAEISAKLCDLVAQPTDANKKARSRFDQTIDLVLGQPNNTPYYQTHADKVAVSVAEEAPFSLRVIEPKTPIVQNGAMNLKVVAERKQGFNGVINIELLYKAPGIGAQATVKIPENQTEAVIPLSASGDAQTRKWKTAVIGSSDAGKGAVWVSSQLFEMETAPPFLTAGIARAVVEQGQTATVICKLTQNKSFDGKAKIKLLGLPNKVTAPEMEITAADEEVHFQITAEKTAPVGQQKSLFCQITVTKDGEPITHNTGQGGILRIDKLAQMAAAK